MDYLECHKEEIHNPNFIQRFGYLIGLDYEDRTIKFYSENIKEIFDIEDEILIGVKFSHFYDIFFEILESKTYIEIRGKYSQGKKMIGEIKIKGQKYHLTVYCYNKTLFVEIEKFHPSVLETAEIFRSIENNEISDDELKVWNDLTKKIARLTQYDRIMVYKFLEDGSGKVVAETKSDALESYLNLYYPESDIPKQARELYLKNRKRIFSNVNEESSPIISETNERLDLTQCSLRAMSPVHAQYLKNAGVASSFSISIIIKNQLWGLITCQNVKQRHIDLYNRIQAEVFTILATNNVAIIQESKNFADITIFDHDLNEIRTKMLSSDNEENDIISYVEKLKSLIDSDGFVYANFSRNYTAGDVPSDTQLISLISWAKENVDGIFSSCSFLNDTGKNLGLDNKAAGVCLCFLDEEKNHLVIWFRKEFPVEIPWAGKTKKEIDDINFFGEWKKTVSPRKSFEIFIENVKGKSLPWESNSEEKLKKIRNFLSVFLNSNDTKIPSEKVNGKKLLKKIEDFENDFETLRNLTEEIILLKKNSSDYDDKTNEIRLLQQKISENLKWN